MATENRSRDLKKPHSSQGWAIALFTIGVFMAGLDNGIIGTALTTINESFGVSPSWGAWSITLYTLGIAISVPIIGKLSDRYGRRRMFLVEITLFGLGSLLVAFSPNFIMLLIARFIQAIGGGGIFIIGSSHILATLPKERQGRALGMLGGMHGLSAVIGPNLGAVILQLTGTWQWMFLINIPIVIFLFIFGATKIEESHPGTSKSMDFTGTILLSLSILSFMLGVTQLEGKSWLIVFTDLRIAVLLLNAIFLFGLLLFYERQLEHRGGDPILSISLLSGRFFQMILLIALFSGGFLAGIIFIPSYVQQVFQVPVENAGFWLTPMALTSGVGAGLGGFLTDRYGAERTIVMSGFIGALGFGLFPFWVSDGFSFVIASIIAGVGLGILLGAPLNVLVGKSARKHEQGSALGILSLSRQIGLTVFPTIFAGYLTSGMADIAPIISSTYGDTAIEVNLNLQSPHDQYSDIVNQIEGLNPSMQKGMFDTIAHILKSGFDQMFITSAILSILVVLSGFYLFRRKP